MYVRAFAWMHSFIPMRASASCLWGSYLYLSICMCEYVHRLSLFASCACMCVCAECRVFRGGGAGGCAEIWPDETEVTGIDHCCSSQAKTLSSLCALGRVLSAPRGSEGQPQSMSAPPLSTAGSVWIYLPALFLTDSSKIRHVSKQTSKY